MRTDIRGIKDKNKGSNGIISTTSGYVRVNYGSCVMLMTHDGQLKENSALV